MKRHAQHHSKEHMKMMRKFMKEGDSFEKAHRKTVALEKKEKKIPKQYVPASLSKEDKKKQIKSIRDKTDRPKVSSFKSRRSPYVVQFEKKYGYKITETDKIKKEILKMRGINQILEKGKGAYYSSGSRPNQTPESWAYGRLASVIMNGPARKIDKKIWDKYKI